MVPMKNTGGAEWLATIPGDRVLGSALQYYLEARDAKGVMLIGAGSAPNPYIIALSSASAGIEAEGEDPLKMAGAEGKGRKGRGKPGKAGGFERMFILVMPGFGIGIQPEGNTTEVAYKYQPGNAGTLGQYVPTPVGATGTAIAPFHTSFEIGAMVTRAFGLSVLARIQWVNGANAESIGQYPGSGTSKAFGAFAILARARYKFRTGEGKRLHPYLHINLGYGHVRHMLDVSSSQNSLYPLVDRATAETFNGNLGDPARYPNGIDNRTGAPYPRQMVCPNLGDCKDTIALGAFLLGGGAGMWVDIVKHLAFIVDLNVLGGVGTEVGGVVGQSGLNIDLQLGLGATFL